MAHALPNSPSRSDDSSEPSSTDWEDEIPSAPLDILLELQDLLVRFTDQESELYIQAENLVYTVERTKSLVKAILEFVHSKVQHLSPQ